ATDTDGWVRTVEFFDGTNSLGVVTNYPILIEPLNTAPTDIDFPLPWPVNPFTLVWPDAPPRHHVLTALATDNLGSSAKSEPVEITILEEPIQPVVTVIATDPIASEGASVPGTTNIDNA